VFRYAKTLSFLAKAALMLFAFWFVLRGVEISQIIEMVKNQSLNALIAAGMCLLIQLFFGATRWRCIITALSQNSAKIISSLHAVRYFYISVFFNCCLPGTVGGDVVRVWLIKSAHTPLPLAINSVVIDRMMALFALGVMGFATLPILAQYIYVNPLIIMPICAISGASGFWALFNLDRLPYLRSINWLTHLLYNLRQLLINKKLALMSLFLAICGHICYCLFVYIIAKSLGNPIALLDTLTLVPWVLLIAIIPLSIGGWGLREAAMVFMLGLISIPQEVAITISVQLGLLSIITALPAGILWLFNRKQAKQASEK
jgi:uncharacterized membrane protein YbhN (UPF0104 family)